MNYALFSRTVYRVTTVSQEKPYALLKLTYRIAHLGAVSVVIMSDVMFVTIPIQGIGNVKHAVITLCGDSGSVVRGSFITLSSRILLTIYHVVYAINGGVNGGNFL